MTTGNAVDFGDLTAARSNGNAFSSSTRGVYNGWKIQIPKLNVDFITIASQGNAIRLWRFNKEYLDLQVVEHLILLKVFLQVLSK